MTKRIDQSSLREWAGVAAGSILGAIVSIAILIAFRVQPAEIDSTLMQITTTEYA